MASGTRRRCFTKYSRGGDGRTAYIRFLGNQVHEEAPEFGEQVLYRKRPETYMNIILNARLLEGLWLGRYWGCATG